jgi:hypothetical protein
MKGGKGGLLNRIPRKNGVESGTQGLSFFKYVVCYYVHRLLSIKYTVQTHDLLIVSPLPLPLDFGFLPMFGWIGI